MASTATPSDQTRIQVFLDDGHAAAAAGRWVEAGLAWIEAAKRGNLEGANLASRIAPPHLKTLADSGDADAQALLAGILMDYFAADALPMAVDHAQRAADNGHAAGLRTLGFMYDRGLGVKKDQRRAMELFKKAAAKGDGYAAFNVAVLEINAKRKTITHDECIRLLNLAADCGIANAGALLGDQLSAADRDEEALKWYVWAAERGHDGATNAAADWYRDGYGTDPDNLQAMRWLLVLCAKPNVDAVHKAHQLGLKMTTDEILEAGRLAEHVQEADILIATLDKADPGWR
jgi:TPR repeat protein